MSAEPQIPSPNSPAFEFKSGVVTVPVLHLFNADINAITHQLREKIQLAPEFFTNSSLLIDLQAIDKPELNLALLVDAIRNAGMLPIGIRGGTPEQQRIAKDLMLSVMSAQASSNDNHSNTTPEPARQEITQTATAVPPVNIESTIIDQPIRSGQRIYVKGDLVIIAQISAGAEIMAEGNIHVYGTLRGRALAGVQGNEKAHIFCSDLQAELISIAGNYRISEDLDESVRKMPVQIYLDKQALIIKKI